MKKSKKSEKLHKGQKLEKQLTLTASRPSAGA